MSDNTSLVPTMQWFIEYNKEFARTMQKLIEDLRPMLNDVLVLAQRDYGFDLLDGREAQVISVNGEQIEVPAEWTPEQVDSYVARLGVIVGDKAKQEPEQPAYRKFRT